MPQGYGETIDRFYDFARNLVRNLTDSIYDRKVIMFVTIDAFYCRVSLIVTNCQSKFVLVEIVTTMHIAISEIIQLA